MNIIDPILIELRKQLEPFEKMSVDELRTFDCKQQNQSFKIFEKIYPVYIWIEEDVDGSYVVLAEIKKKFFMGGGYTAYERGIRIKNGVVNEMTDQEMWEFD